AGLGVLTAALARAARLVHAVEIDRRLAPALDEAVGEFDNVRLHWGDAMKLEWEALDPAPTCLVANLPYDVATPIVLDSLRRLPGVDRWSVLVQREVADRWLAEPGTREYGAASVVLQLATEATFRRPVGREVFSPRPRVDSMLVALRRRAERPDPAVRALARAAFATRRKTLRNSLVAAGAEGAAVVAALQAMHLGSSVRPAELTPAHYRELTERLSWTP
ncbi:MAG: 16S rRNA (adenine(1518)-N(6)/adenine(1519)-N(6))-dimethyltransferase RsmA, partial [Miltoncostaeaceae bacterium]